VLSKKDKQVMRVEIWSDVACPFCYIGKKRFEEAVQHFAQKDRVQVEWKSFQLDPGIQSNKYESIHDYLAEKKGWSPEYAQQMNEHVTQMAQEAGLDFKLDQAVVANSFDAHQLSHLAAKKGKQNELEEKLFAAYFTQGQNIADHAVLAKMGEELGFDKQEVLDALASKRFASQVKADIALGAEFGVRGVPFFVFDRKYAVSGAQASETFLEILEKAWQEAKPVLQQTEGDACSPEDGCVV
jgi:predicted DsbA family dithiol-disulfide isomerase